MLQACMSIVGLPLQSCICIGMSKSCIMILYVLGHVSDGFVWHADDDDGDNSESDASDCYSDSDAQLPGWVVAIVLQLRTNIRIYLGQTYL